MKARTTSTSIFKRRWQVCKMRNVFLAIVAVASFLLGECLTDADGDPALSRVVIVIWKALPLYAMTV